MDNHLPHPSAIKPRSSFYQLVYYPKPSDGEFNLMISSNLFNQTLINQVKVFLYQSDGDFQKIELSDLISDQQDLKNLEQLTLQIDYSKSAESTFNLSLEEKTVDEQKLIKIDELVAWSKTNFESGQLSFYLFYQLNLLIDSIRDHLDYFFLLEKFLEFHQL